MEKNCIAQNGKLYRIVNEKLLDIAFGNNEVNTNLYYYLIRSEKPNILVIQDKVYWHQGTSYKEAQTQIISQNEKMTYFYIVSEKEEDRCVFYKSKTGKVVFMGRRFEEVRENDLFKIGKHLYQLLNGELVYIQKCESYEFWRDRLEVYVGEKDCSELFVYEKKCGIWMEVYKEIPGIIYVNRH